MSDKLQAKYLNLRDLTLFTVSAIILLDTLAAGAAVGVSSLFWWGFLGLIFLLPIALITAELGTSYPAEGGIYVWVRQAFGRRWASRAVWAYWVNTAVWLPAIYIFAASFVSQLFGLELSLSGVIVFGIVLVWMTVAIDFIGLDIGKWVPNAGALFKMIVFGLIIIGGFYYASEHGMANEITLEALKPEWSEGIQYIPVIIYGMLGFELISSAGDEIEKPRRNVPLGILLSGLIVLVLYTAATAAILAAIPSDEIDLVEGLLDTFRLLFADVPGANVFVMVVGLMALFTFFSNGVTWALGCNRAAAQAGREGELPSIFSWSHRRHGGPVGSAFLMGIFCTVILLLYGGIATTNEDLFWGLFAFSAVIFMLPYVGMVLSFWKMRQIDPDTERPYRVPGGFLGARLLAGICALVLLSAISLFVYVPGEGLQVPTVIGFVVIWLLGEVLIRFAEFQSRRRKARD